MKASGFRLRAPALFAALAILALAGAAHADPVALPADQGFPKELEGIGIEDRHGVDLPRDLVLRDQEGKTVTLGEYFDGQRPVILVMAYYQCPMLCSVVMTGLTHGAQEIAWTAGKEYRIVSVSFDARDTVELAAAKRKNYLEAYGRPVTGEKAWDFLIADETTAKTLAETVGFHYRWDKDTNQFAHAAGAFVITPGGKLSRTLYGIQFLERDLRLALVEASEGKLGSAWDKVLLFCYHYDPNGRGYTLAVMKIVRISGLLTVLALAFFLLRFWRRERRRTRLEHATP